MTKPIRNEMMIMVSRDSGGDGGDSPSGGRIAVSLLKWSALVLLEPVEGLIVTLSNTIN